jgi:hypothetical protein
MGQQKQSVLDGQRSEQMKHTNRDQITNVGAFVSKDDTESITEMDKYCHRIQSGMSWTDSVSTPTLLKHTLKTLTSYYQTKMSLEPAQSTTQVYMK